MLQSIQTAGMLQSIQMTGMLQSIQTTGMLQSIQTTRILQSIQTADSTDLAHCIVGNGHRHTGLYFLGCYHLYTQPYSLISLAHILKPESSNAL